MPLANIKLIEGVMSPEAKKQLIQGVTDAIVAVEGDQIRDKTVVIVEEAKSGDWGIGGTPVTTSQVKALEKAG
jgi:4-oxalocrotonate tautomerase